jgi:hypothetical protein
MRASPSRGGAEQLAPRLVGWPEAPRGLGAGLRRGHALTHELLGAQLQVQADLLVHLLLAQVAAPQLQPERAADAGADHAGPGAVRIPVTVAAYRTQRSVSASRWARPAGVTV